MPDVEQLPSLYIENLLGRATTVSVASASTSQPGARLYDRDVGTYYREGATATGSGHVFWDLGATSTHALDAVVMGPHRLVGATVVVETSSSTTTWNALDTFAPTSTGAYRRLVASTQTRYGRVRWTGATAPVEIAEILVSRRVAFPKGPHPEEYVERVLTNRARIETIGGAAWTSPRGPRRRQIEMVLRNLETAERQTIEDAFSAADDAGHFWHEDDSSGTLRWVEWLDEEQGLTLAHIALGRRDVSVLLREVVG